MESLESERENNVWLGADPIGDCLLRNIRLKFRL